MIKGKKLPLQNEDILNLELALVVPDVGNIRIATGETHLLLNGQVIPVDLATIPMTEIERLYQQVSSYTSPDTGCLTALRVSYGARTVDGEIEMDLFYRPVYLGYDEYHESTHSYMYSILERGDLFNFRNGVFEIASEQDYDSAFTLFKDSITIKHTLEATNYEPFVSGTDVDNVLIPFQTIFTLLLENDNDTLVLKNNVETVLNQLNYTVKQSILLFTEEITPRGAFAGQFANRGTWGPPENLQFGFTLLGY